MLEKGKKAATISKYKGPGVMQKEVTSISPSSCAGEGGS